MSTDEKMMKLALEQAILAKDEGEVPIGAVLTAPTGELLGCGHNQTERLKDPTAHAEIMAIRAACQRQGDWRLSNMTLYVTLEPCPMCAGAIIQARIARVVFGAYDARYGCTGSVYRLTEDPAFLHFAKADGGVLADECARILQDTWMRA